MKVERLASRAILAAAIALNGTQAPEQRGIFSLPPTLSPERFPTEVLVPSVEAKEIRDFNNTIARINRGTEELDHSCFIPLVMKEWSPFPSTSPLKGVAGIGSIEDMSALGVKWAYSWRPLSAGTINYKGESVKIASYYTEIIAIYAEQGITIVPMLPARPDADDIAAIEEFVAQHPDLEAYLLYNEPRNPQQNDPLIEPSEAVETLDLYAGIVGKDKIIFGNVVALDAWGFLEAFKIEYDLHGQYNTPPIKGIGGHAYYNDCVYRLECGPDGDLPGFREWLDRFKDRMSVLFPGKEIWITEFGTLYEDAHGAIPFEQVLEGIVGWFEEKNIPYAPYATIADGTWCPGCCCDLLLPGGGLTEEGMFYRNLP